MKLIEIKTGLKLELEVFNRRNEKIEPVFTSQFEKALDDDYAIIYAPIHKGKIYPIHTGWVINVNFIKDDNMYRFYAKVIDRKIKDHIALLVIKAISNIERIQRRNFFRFICNLPINYRVQDLESEIDGIEPDYKNAITKDLSGNGVCIKLKEQVEINKVIECELSINDHEKIFFTGLVVRSIKINEDNNFTYEIGVLFKNIDKRDRDHIVKFIFAEQRKLRKRGLV